MGPPIYFRYPAGLLAAGLKLDPESSVRAPHTIPYRGNPVLGKLMEAVQKDGGGTYRPIAYQVRHLGLDSPAFCGKSNVSCSEPWNRGFVLIFQDIGKSSSGFLVACVCWLYYYGVLWVTTQCYRYRSNPNA